MCKNIFSFSAVPARAVKFSEVMVACMRVIGTFYHMLPKWSIKKKNRKKVKTCKVSFMQEFKYYYCYKLLFKIMLNFTFSGVPARPVKSSEVMVVYMSVPSIQTTTAPPMRLSKVQANTTWESLQTAGADCCVPLGLVSILICKIKGKFGF